MGIDENRNLEEKEAWFKQKAANIVLDDRAYEKSWTIKNDTLKIK